MHYYKFNIGDYRKKTAHLTLQQHGIYRLMLDTYYINQEPFPDDFDEICRLLNIRTKREKEGVRIVLKDFFRLDNNLYFQKRCEEEIEEYTLKSDKARSSANFRWHGIDANAMQTHSEGNANHKPLTNNHKPITKEKDKGRFTPPSLEKIKEVIIEKGYEVNANLFFNHYESNGWKVGKNAMKSWESALSNWNLREKTDNPDFIEKIRDRSWANESYS